MTNGICTQQTDTEPVVHQMQNCHKLETVLESSLSVDVSARTINDDDNENTENDIGK
jgi:hypothetical protein